MLFQSLKTVCACHTCQVAGKEPMQKKNSVKQRKRLQCAHGVRPNTPQKNYRTSLNHRLIEGLCALYVCFGQSGKETAQPKKKPGEGRKRSGKPYERRKTWLSGRNRRPEGL